MWVIQFHYGALIVKLLLGVAGVLFLNGCYLSTSITDIDAISSSKGDNLSPPDEGGITPTNPSTDPTTPTPPVPTPPSGLLVSLSASNLAKIHSYVDYTITLSEAAATDVLIDYETQDVSALSPQSYVNSKGTVKILAGNTSGTFKIPTTNKSDPVGTFKDFIVRLTNSSLGSILTGDIITSVGMYQLSNVKYLLSSSFYAYCALDNYGKVWCWGNYSNIDSAKRSPELNFQASKISVGFNHKCGLTPSAGVKCWGANFAGNLGDGTNNDSPTAPVDVVGLSSGVLDIKSGISHTCALLSTGGVKCWGLNGSGQLGNNSTLSSNVPVDVSGLTAGVSKIYTGGNYSCALLTATQGVKCWGENTKGTLGDGTNVSKSVPIDVLGLMFGVLDLTVSVDNTCAITTSNALKCWGSNINGQLGDGTTVNRNSPTNVVGLSSNVTKISISSSHACALLTDVTIKCWGVNTFSELGDGTFSQSLVPVTATNLTGSIQDVQVNSNSTCILKADERVYCIGNNTDDMLGDGNPTYFLRIPQKVFNSGNNIKAASMGKNHTCYINSTNGIECFGDNLYGQIGDNTSYQRAIPTPVFGLSSGVTALAAGRYHSCALLNTGTVKCWGRNSYGQLGDNSNTLRRTPVDVLGLTNVIAIVAGGSHSCALINTGAVKCWGYNGDGQLGDNTTISRITPVAVTGLSLPVTSLTAGFTHTCGILNNGTVNCWGSNDDGELGNGTTTRSSVPVNVSGISSGATKVSGAQFATCAIVAQAVKCWGANYSGELGDNTWNQSSVPVDVIGAHSNIIDIMASGDDYSDYVCGLTTLGGMKCWGDNGSFEAGNEQLDRYGNETAKDVVGLKTGVSQLVQGKGLHNCVIGIDGNLKCFGSNETYNKAGGVIYTTPQSVLVAPEDI